MIATTLSIFRRLLCLLSDAIHMLRGVDPGDIEICDNAGWWG